MVIQAGGNNTLVLVIGSLVLLLANVCFASGTRAKCSPHRLLTVQTVKKDNPDVERLDVWFRGRNHLLDKAIVTLRPADNDDPGNWVINMYLAGGHADFGERVRANWIRSDTVSMINDVHFELVHGTVRGVNLASYSIDITPKNIFLYVYGNRRDVRTYWESLAWRISRREGINVYR